MENVRAAKTTLRKDIMGLIEKYEKTYCVKVTGINLQCRPAELWVNVNAEIE